MRRLIAAALWLIALPTVALDEAGLRAQHMQRLDEPAPDFVLRDASGTAVHLAALRGRPVIVHFWATWCIPCRKELPTIQALARRLANTDCVFLAVAIDTGAVDLRAYAADLGFILPVYRAGDGEISDRYWSWGIPATYLIDRDGAIAGRALGPRDWTSDSMLALMRRFTAR